MNNDLPEMVVPPAFWRVSTKGLIVNDLGQVLLVQDSVGDWCLPGGAIEHGERPDQALDRELREEIAAGLRDSVGPPLAAWTCLDFEYKAGPTPRVVMMYTVELDSEPTMVDGEVYGMRWFTIDELADVTW